MNQGGAVDGWEGFKPSISRFSSENPGRARRGWDKVKIRSIRNFYQPPSWVTYLNNLRI